MAVISKKENNYTLGKDVLKVSLAFKDLPNHQPETQRQGNKQHILLGIVKGKEQASGMVEGRLNCEHSVQGTVGRV